MHVDLATMIHQFGYLAILVGALLEGETVLVLGGFAAHQGHLALPSVMALAAMGGFLGDQLYFVAGRRFGVVLINRFPSATAKIRRADRWILRHPALSVIGVRFFYGLRIAGPVAIGMTSMSWMRFAVLNFIGAVVWAILITSMGYFFGHAAQTLWGDLRPYEEWIVLLLVLAALLAYGIGRLRDAKTR
jgi:membrane protein DedA with SNARE-associated domain